MKLSKIEQYNLELSKDELLFIMEVIEKMQLDPSSPPQAFAIHQRFKEFYSSEVLPTSEALPASDTSLKCDGCETDVDVSTKFDPATKQTLPLCPVCLAHRSGYSL